MPWIVNEDEALKELLAGQTVSDDRNANRPVQVYYGLPDPEVRDKMFPFISIDLVDLSIATERVMSGPYYHRFPYMPEGYDLPDNNQALSPVTLPPTPYNFDYQVTTWTRLPRHDRQLLGNLLGGPLPYQFGAVGVSVDGTTRRLDLTGFSKSDMLDENKKKIFRNVFSLRMSSELFYFQLQGISTVWSSANITIPQYSVSASVHP
jgi:hypothetical protein